MKISFYAQEGLQQIILTPENAPERAILDLLHQPREITVLRGSFKETVGGYVRQFEEEESTMLVLRKSADPMKFSAGEINAALKNEGYTG